MAEVRDTRDCSNAPSECPLRSEGVSDFSQAREGLVQCRVFFSSEGAPARTAMPQSFSCLHTHIVFSTKHRQRFLTPDLTERLHPYLGGLARNRKCDSVRIGGVEDHVHLLVRLARDVAVSEFVGAVKSVSSGWIHDEFPDRPTFAWQQGYAAFAVSLSGVEAVAAYIGAQAEHHRRKTFQEELLEFLGVHGIASDERYMWD